MNSCGTRVLTSGIDVEQFKRNPVLLWMHRRAFDGESMPIGKIENLRVEEGKLIGRPVFDQNDEFARKIESKWESGFLRMASAALEPIEVNPDPALALEGQTRATVTRCKLIEVSIVDIGGNDEALQLCGADGKQLKLAAGEDAPALPLLAGVRQTINLSNPEHTPEEEPGEWEEPESGRQINNNNKNQTTAMNKEQLMLLGLPEGASEEQATAALQLMKTRADSAETMQLAAVSQHVDQAIADKKILASQRDHYIKLGKAAGAEMLADTFKAMPTQQKPTDTLNLSQQSAVGGGSQPKAYAKLSEVPQSELIALRKDKPAEYMRLYKEEYGVDCPPLSE